jgi:hypothetical protein
MSNKFLKTIEELRQGGAAHDLGEALTDLVKAVRETGRPGALTVKLTVKPASKGDVNTLLLEDAVTVKRPQPERGATIFFSTDDNGLQRNDPRQPELSGLRKPAEVTPLRTVNSSQE